MTSEIIDHILLVGFGAPSEKGQIPEFLSIVARGRQIPKERLQEVEHHYELIGGQSPYNGEVLSFRDRLEKNLKNNGMNLPVFAGMRNWTPFLKEAVSDIASQGFRRGLAIILSPFHSKTSCERYKRDVEEAIEAAGVSVAYEYLDSWFDHSLFVNFYARQISQNETEQGILAREKGFLFTAHSIPVAMAEACEFCDYQKEFKTAAGLIAREAGLPEWMIGYQSRSGSPREPWLGPDVAEVIEEFLRQKKKKVTVVPVGFFCENVEILYDLDWELKRLVTGAGLSYTRIRTFAESAAAVEMFRLMIQNRLCPASK